MPTLLQLDSSGDLETSRTRALTRAFADVWRERGNTYTVVRRDLHTQPLPHLVSTAQHWPVRLRGGVEVPPDLDLLQQEILDELLAADAVVVGAPMYNYGIAATLKAWIDLIHVPGTTAAFDIDSRPMAGRPAVIVTARGGPSGPEDAYVIGPLTAVLEGGLGMTVSSVSTTRTLADRVPDLDPALAAAELENARRDVARIAASLSSGR